MKLTIFLLFMVTASINAQENIYEVHMNATPIAPTILNLNALQNNDSLFNNSEALQDEIIDSRLHRKYKKYTIHPPRKAQILSEYKKAKSVSPSTKVVHTEGEKKRNKNSSNK